jgi:hypothetical protein
MSMFYERLYEALEILVDFFHADQKGLSMESLKTGETDIFNNLSHLLDYKVNDCLKQFSIKLSFDYE